MPTSVIAMAIGTMAGEFVAGVVFADMIAVGLSAGWAYTAVAGATSFLVGGAVTSALRGGSEKAPTSSPSFSAQATQRAHMIRSSVANRQTVYGRAMVSGPIVFATSTNDNNNLHMVIALAGHECDGIEEIWFGDELVGTRDVDGYVIDGKFATYARVIEHLGDVNQAADDELVFLGAGWTDAHRLRGCTYLYVHLGYNRDVYPRGIPNVKVLLRGKKLYDPRSATTVWSNNLALATRDYLTGTHGLSCTSAEIDDTAMIAAANICDESVTLAAGGTESRYTCNAVFDSGMTPRATMEAILSGCGGALTWPAGLYTLHVGAYESPTVTLDEDDLAGPVNVRARAPRQDLFNAIKGTYVDPDKYWQPGDFPPITNSTYATQDGAQIFRDVAFPVTTSSATAQRLARMMVEKSRQAITVQASFSLAAFKLTCWENVMLSISSLGWSSKVFKITGWEFNPAGSVTLTLQEEASACYTWSAEETIDDPAPDTTLPDPTVIAAPGVPEVTETLYETTGSAGLKARATMTWSVATDAFVLDYLPEYRIAAGTWVALPATAGLTAGVDDIAPGSYEFRLRQRNVYGVVSAYGGTRAKEILGLTAAPENVTGFSVIKSGGFALASWQLAGDLDVRIGGRIVIRHSPLTTGAAWENGIIVEEFNGDAVTGSLPLMTGTYMAKALDSTGNYSATAATFVATEGTVTGWATVATTTQEPTFTGSKSNTAVLDGALRLDSVSTLSSMTELVSAWPKISALGGLSASGSYEFAAAVDLGTVATRRFEADIAATNFDTGDLISFRDLVTTWSAVSGATVNDCDATLYIATTDDDPAGSPTWSDWVPFFVADFTARAAKFKIDLASGSATHNIAISTLAIDIKEPA